MLVDVPTTTTTATAPRSSALWAPDRRAATAGLILLITLAAFEAMGVGTALPTLVRELHGERLYSWPFTAFLAASVVGTVLSGRLSDRRGPTPALIIGPVLFLAGLVVAGTAGGMPQLLAGRLLQGLGGGAQAVALYVLIALVYPERDRPAAFGALSAAWVVPSLVGPTIAGLLTQYLTWRLVFLGLAPLVLVGVLVLIPVIRRLPASPERAEDVPRRRAVPWAAAGASIGVSALTWAAQHPSAGSLVLGVVGLGLTAPSLRVLLPAGTLTARRGLPVMVLARSMLAGAFFGVQAYLPLTLASVHGYTPAMAGVPLTIGALGWSAASMWQGQRPDIPRERLVRLGFVLLAIGLGLVTLVAPAWGLSWVAVPAWTLAGAGMGLSISSVAVRVINLSQPADRGFNGAALQLSDMFGQAVFIGLGGVLVVALASASRPTAAVVPLDLAMAGVCVVGALLLSRRGTISPM